MKKTLLSLILLILTSNLLAQNLVTNPGFEDYDNCPTGAGEIYCPLSPFPGFPPTLKHWISPLQNSPTYYHACSQSIYSSVPVNNYGNHPAHGGDAYTSVTTYGGTLGWTMHDEFFSQYICAPLTQPMIQAQIYEVSCYVKLIVDIDPLHFININGVDAIHAAFTDTMVLSQGSPIAGQHLHLKGNDSYIMDTADWVKISGYYVAEGGEEFITLGVFDDGANPGLNPLYPHSPPPFTQVFSRYFIDDVSVTPVGPCDTTFHSHDTTICSLLNEPLQLTSSSTGAYTFTWSTGTNNYTADINSGGTYWCVAKIKGCNSVVDTFNVRFYKDSTYSNTTINKCNSIDISLESKYENAQYKWNTQAETPQIQISDSGNYWVKAVENCRLHIDSFDVISLKELVQIELGSDTSICKTEDYIIGDFNNEHAVFTWNTGETSCCISPTRSGSYILTVADSCTSYTDSVNIKVQHCNNCIFVPTAFSPNDDGLNDRLGVRTSCDIDKFSFHIYNRWGQLVFGTNNPDERWNGLQKADYAQVGSYYYYIRYNTLQNPEMQLLKGDITLLR